MRWDVLVVLVILGVAVYFAPITAANWVAPVLLVAMGALIAALLAQVLNNSVFHPVYWVVLVVVALLGAFVAGYSGQVVVLALLTAAAGAVLTYLMLAPASARSAH